MSEPRRHGHGRNCDPELVFELADGALTPERRRQARTHLEACPGCRELYERETDLSARLVALDLGAPRSVCREVAMALPTRPLKVRLLWAAVAAVLLSAAVVALNMVGDSPVAFATGVMGVFWNYAGMFANALGAVLDVAGPALLVALAAGAVADLVLAGVIYAAARRSQGA